MSRTIVVSDLHGRIQPLERALDHAGFANGDTLVVAGDLIDVGDEDALGFAESLGAVILVGNHEVAAATGLRIAPQDPESLLRGPGYGERMVTGEWKLAHATQGHLVTHAGVSTALSDIVAVHEAPEGLARELNERFLAEIAAATAEAPLSWDDLDRYRLIGSQMGPLWFRPFQTSQLPSGLRQIVGHTAMELLTPAVAASVRSAGWTLVEPGGHELGARSQVFRYALVEDGVAEIFEG